MVLSTHTAQAAKAGITARLIMKAGGEIIGAPVVMQAIDNRDVSLGVSPEDNSAALVATILGQ